MTTPNSFKAQQEGRPYQPPVATDRMQGSVSQPTQQPWVEQPSYQPYEGEVGNQYQQEYSEGYEGNTQQAPTMQQGYKPKTTATAAILSFYLTPYGAANFYLGRKLQGVSQVLLGIFALIILVVTFSIGIYVNRGTGFYVLAVLTVIAYAGLLIWTIVDFIRIVTKKPPMDRDANGVPLA